MRVLVTGAAGFIGSHVCEALVAQGNQVVGIDAFIPYYPRELKERNLRHLLLQPSFQFAEVDLRTDALAPYLAGVDVVINEAAMPGLVRSWDMFDSYMSCNLLAVKRLLDACREASVQRVIHISTSSVYGANAIGNEEQPVAPVSPYGVTKLAAENLIQAYVSEFGLQASILRYFSVYGPRQRPDMAYSIFIRSMIEGKPITVFGDGTQSRSNTFVADCVEGTLRAIDGAKVGEVYNIGGGAVLELKRSLEIIADALGVSPVLTFSERRAGDQMHTSADTTRARNDFGYQPVVTPEEGLLAQVQWIKDEAQVAAGV